MDYFVTFLENPSYSKYIKAEGQSQPLKCRWLNTDCFLILCFSGGKPGESEAGGIFGFISKPKTTPPNKPQQEGIYLEEINKLDDPEIAKYFPKR